MKNLRHQTRPGFDSLDERIVPSAAHAVAVAHAELAHHAAVHHAQVVQARAETHPAAHHKAPAAVAHKALAAAHGKAHAKAQAHAALNLPSVVYSVSTPSASATLQASLVPVSAAQTVATASSTQAGTSSAANPSIASTVVTPNATTSASTNPTSNATQETGTPLPKMGTALNTIYQDYLAFVQGGSQGTFRPSDAKFLEIQGTNIEVDIQGSGDLGTFVTELQGLGMQVVATNATIVMVEGSLPISQLANAAALSNTVSINPVYQPQLL